MKYVAPIRKELGIRTVFNILGPLSNPAGANMELMGVYEQELVEPLAQVMAKLGVVRGMVVYGQDKLDEISMSAPTSVCEIGTDGSSLMRSHRSSLVIPDVPRKNWQEGRRRRMQRSQKRSFVEKSAGQNAARCA